MPKFIEPSQPPVPDIYRLQKTDNIIDPFQIRAIFNSIFRKRNWSKRLQEAQLRKIKLPAPGEGLPRVLHYCADQGGCAFWRLIFVGDELMANNKAVVQTMYQVIPDARAYMGLSAVRLQRQCNDTQIKFVKELKILSDSLKKQNHKGFKIIYEIDDIILPAGSICNYNLCKSSFIDPKIEQNVKEIMNYIDEMTVPSEFMRDHYKKHLGFDKISVIPNYVPKYWFDKGVTKDIVLDRYRRNLDKPRVMYAGSSTHFDLAGVNGQVDDFYHVTDAILKDLTLDKKYQWVFVGGVPRRLRSFVESGQIELHKWTSMTDYPSLLNDLKINVMIAPLLDNDFNKAKANIKLTEGAALGIPCIAQNIQCYNSDGWKYLFNSGEEMMQQLSDVLATEESIGQAFDNIVEYGSRYWLKDHLDEWIKIYTTPYGDPTRKELTDFYERNKQQFGTDHLQ